MRALNAAAVARAEAVWIAERVHEIGEVPDSPATPYVAISASAGSTENHRNDGTHGSRGHRIVAQAVGRTVGEVGFAVEKAEAAFLDHRLAVPGFDTTPATVEVASPIIRDPDAGAYLLCTLTFTFQAYPKET